MTYRIKIVCFNIESSSCYVVIIKYFVPENHFYADPEGNL